MSSDVAAEQHLAALRQRYEGDLEALRAKTVRARETLDGHDAALREAAAGSGSDRPHAFADLPMDSLQPYIPPSHPAAANALIPDTPLLGGPFSDPPLSLENDAPLWQD